MFFLSLKRAFTGEWVSNDQRYESCVRTAQHEDQLDAEIETYRENRLPDLPSTTKITKLFVKQDVSPESLDGMEHDSVHPVVR